MTRFTGGPAESPGFVLWHATLAWQRSVTAALRPLRLTHVQFVLLASTWWLEDQGGSPNQQRVAEHAGTEVRMTSQVLRKLERDGWLERRVDPQDSRARQLHVTPAGAELARRAIAVVEDVDAQTFGDDGPALVALLADERVPSRTTSA